MNAEELEAKVRELLRLSPPSKVERAGRDLVLSFNGGNDVLDDARTLADGLGHKGIDFKANYEDLDEMIRDHGCDTCGYGAVIVLKGILPS